LLFKKKRAIVSLDKTLIHRLESFKAFWTVCSLYCVFWTLNRLVQQLKCIIWRQMLEC